MKVKHDEPDRCLKIKKIKKIKNNNKKKKTINGKIKLDLIKSIHNIRCKKRKNNDVIFRIYSGLDLKDLLWLKL